MENRHTQGQSLLPTTGEIARQRPLSSLKPRYPDAQFYLDLRGADPKHQSPLTPGDAMRHVILSIDPTRPLPEEEESLRAIYLSELENRRALLLMDNAADAAQVEPLLPPETW